MVDVFIIEVVDNEIEWIVSRIDWIVGIESEWNDLWLWVDVDGL